MGRSDIDWGTVERSDVPLQEDDTTTTRMDDGDVLEVPEFTASTLDAMEAEAEAQEQAQDYEPPQEQRGVPGSFVECEVCGRSVRVRKDGALSRHKCEPKAQRGNRFEHLPQRGARAPRKVHDFLVTVVAWGVEEGSAHALARPFGVDPDDVPTELPDAEGMVGPPIDLLWPNIPDSAQAFISACADNSDLIACVLAWGDWLRILGKWTRDQRAYQQSLAEQERQHGPTQFAATDGIGRVVPFQPA